MTVCKRIDWGRIATILSLAPNRLPHIRLMEGGFNPGVATSRQNGRIALIMSVSVIAFFTSTYIHEFGVSIGLTGKVIFLRARLDLM